MQQVILTIGLPGSGKSTWAKEYCEKNTDWVRVNRDDLRRMRGKYWLPKDEDMITDMERMCVAQALYNKKNVILDATNLNPKHINSLKNWFKSDSLEIEFIEKRFDVSPEECIKRDAKRGNESVGEQVIWDMYYKYIAPPPMYVEDWQLLHCVICDIDGTLATSAHRSPYEWDKVGQDQVVPFVHQAISQYKYYSQDNMIILMSGRDSGCRDITIDWLDKNRIPYDGLFMRAAGDHRKDSIVKKELFEQHIRGKYYVDYVIDDRLQVVRMWRMELGLNVFQCDWGNF